jgi:hypothetical protein
MLAASAAFFMAARPAGAQSVCGQRDQMVVGLERNYAEAPVSMGLASNGAVVEVFASAAGTWTIIMTHPNGLCCLLMAGEGWEILPAPLKEGPLL